MKETFLYAKSEAIAFHGTKDPWATNSQAIKALARERRIPVVLIEGANHSLETGDAVWDIQNLLSVMKQVETFIG